MDKNENIKKISVLLNRNLFFLSTVYIREEDDGFCLIIKHGKFDYSEAYETARGAKIAFTKLFKARSSIEDIKGKWSHFYEPEGKEWQMM